MEKNGSKIKIEHRVTKLEASLNGYVREFGGDIADIKRDLSNHINDLKRAICNVDTKVGNIEKDLNKRPTWLITSICSLALGLLMFILGYFI